MRVEWLNGLLSQIFRDFSNATNFQHEWIVLDGDIDAEWIETMNTVMDDNKLLTLVSSERIPLTPPMRLLFEIADLRNASPATVSRAGVIFINDDDIGWQPFVQTWLDTRPDEVTAANPPALRGDQGHPVGPQSIFQPVYLQPRRPSARRSARW